MSCRFRSRASDGWFTHLLSSSSETRPPIAWSRCATPSSHSRKPGIGDSVANVRSCGSSARIHRPAFWMSVPPSPIPRKAVRSMRAELPQLRTFATLSPIPGFREWLEGVAQRDQAIGGLVSLLEDNKWVNQPSLARLLKRQLIPLCSYYLLYARRGTQPSDAVARFHLGNGARLERVNWLGDVSEAGLTRSAGLAANYRYSLKQLQRNQESYISRGTIAASRRIERWATLASCEGREPVLDYRQFGVN